MSKRRFILDKSVSSCAPMPQDKRTPYLPRHGICSTAPAERYFDALQAAGAGTKMLIFGDPSVETLLFQHERLFKRKYRENLQPPRIADLLPEVRRLLLEGKSVEAAQLSVKGAREDGYEDKLKWSNGMEIPVVNFQAHPALLARLGVNASGPVKDYLRTLDFESGEAAVRWKDDRGDWVRRGFVSIPRQLAVLRLIAPSGAPGFDLALDLSVADSVSEHPWENMHFPEDMLVTRDYGPDMLLTCCRYNPEVNGNSGYAVAVGIRSEGGTPEIRESGIQMQDVRSVMLFVKILHMPEYDTDDALHLAESVRSVSSSYEELLAENREVLGEKMQRSTLSLGTGEDRALSVEELLAEQHGGRDFSLRLVHRHGGCDFSPKLVEQHGGRDFSPRLVELLYDMGRFFLITDTGTLPPAWGQYNINVNLQVCSGNITNLPEEMEVFFRFIESRIPDFRVNAQNIFGCRGILGDIHPDRDNGLLYHFSSTWPHHYWVSCAGWVYNEFWGHWLSTGDQDFLRTRVVPGLKEIALFFMDYLKDRDAQGNYLFYPGFSPENALDMKTWCGVTVNATMDIMVCREVFENLISACEILDIQDEDLPVWQEILDHLPHLLLDEEGGLKEWAWDAIPEDYNHRHVSHHYDAWPGQAASWEETPELARAILISNRKRGQQDDSAHGILHRIFTAIRLKDPCDFSMNLKQILEHGFLNRNLSANHYPYRIPCPDVTGSLPAVFAEMAVSSRPGVIEFLPAMPGQFGTGRLTGICSYSFARVSSLEWDLEKGFIQAELFPLTSQRIHIGCGLKVRFMTADGRALSLKDNRAWLELEKGKAVTVTLAVEQRRFV